MSLGLSSKLKLTPYNIAAHFSNENSTCNRDSQEDNNEKEEHLSGSLIHGM